MAAVCHLKFLKFSYLVIRPSLSYKSAAVYQISSKSHHFSLRYGDFTIFKMADLRHLEFLGSNNGFFEKLMEVVNRYHSSKLLSFWRKSRFCVCILATDRRTIEQMDRANAQRRSRCRERRLTNGCNTTHWQKHGAVILPLSIYSAQQPQQMHT